jgi:4-carboxymuconolactone decarboxylase
MRTTTSAESVLRRLAVCDEALVRSFLVPAPTTPRRASGAHGLPVVTVALVELGALVAVGASTNSLRWAVERAVQAGAQDDEIVEVLATVGAAVGSARIVAAAPRLALAIGYDVELEGWDGC